MRRGSRRLPATLPESWSDAISHTVACHAFTVLTEPQLHGPLWPTVLLAAICYRAVERSTALSVHRYSCCPAHSHRSPYLVAGRRSGPMFEGIGFFALVERGGVSERVSTCVPRGSREVGWRATPVFVAQSCPLRLPLGLSSTKNNLAQKSGRLSCSPRLVGGLGISFFPPHAKGKGEKKEIP